MGITYDAPLCTCERCGRPWAVPATKDIPRCCPSCKSPYWNKPRIPKQIV